MNPQRIKIIAPELNVMAAAVQKASKGLIRDFGEIENLQVSKKGPGDFVSTADHRSEKILRQELEKARPDYGFLMEESGTVEGNVPYRWIIDPLDGTTNFLHGLPHFCIAVALEHHQEIIAALVYDPIKDEMFYAKKGMGAYMNERRIRVANRNKIQDALGVISIPRFHYDKRDAFMTATHALSRESGSLRTLGSTVLNLCYVASGRADFFVGAGLSPWDIAPGILMIREAGGYISSFDGNRDVTYQTDSVAGNEILHPALVKTFRNF